MWMAVAVTAMIFAVGNMMFGHLVEGTPKWKRVTKVVWVVELVAVIYAEAGTPVWTCTGCADARGGSRSSPLVASTSLRQRLDGGTER